MDTTHRHCMRFVAVRLTAKMTSIFRTPSPHPRPDEIGAILSTIEGREMHSLALSHVCFPFGHDSSMSMLSVEGRKNANNWLKLTYSDGFFS